jgi:hypothetical protein
VLWEDGQDSVDKLLAKPTMMLPTIWLDQNGVDRLNLDALETLTSLRVAHDLKKYYSK